MFTETLYRKLRELTPGELGIVARDSLAAQARYESGARAGSPEEAAKEHHFARFVRDAIYEIRIARSQSAPRRQFPAG